MARRRGIEQSARSTELISSQITRGRGNGGVGAGSSTALVADIIANAPDPVFVSDLEGKILVRRVTAPGTTSASTCPHSAHSRTAPPA